MAERIKLDRHAAESVDAYLEYRRIVGDDDGGTPFTEKQYKEYKKRVLPQRLKNRLFVSWTNPEGMDCIQVGPETECFCRHRYKQHRTDLEVVPEARPIPLPCKVKGCQCGAFHLMVKNCGQAVMCHCKHRATEHVVVPPYVCSKRECLKCQGFRSSFTCECGLPAHQHETLVETASEREARGHPVGRPTPYQAMGGITGFSSLAAGYQRLDPSGVGAPNAEWLNQDITDQDHPFLRGQLQAIKQDKMIRPGGPDLEGVIKDQQERMSQLRLPGESELDYYERRYQEWQKRGGGCGGGRGGKSVAVSIGGPPPGSNQLSAPQAKTQGTRSVQQGSGRGAIKPKK